MMKALAKLTVWLVAGTAMACGSSGDGGLPDSGPIEDAPAYVDNCTETERCTLTDGMMASDYVAPVGDTDNWFLAVPSAGRVLRVLVTNDADFSPIRLEVTLFDPNGTPTTRSFNGNGKQTIDIQLVAPVAGEYRVFVHDNSDDAADRRNPYFITASLLAETDMNEPNDTPAQAVALTAGTPVSGTIGVQGDKDWFAIDVAANQLINIAMVFPARPNDEGVIFKYVLFDPTGMTPLAESIEPAGSTMLRENRAVGNAAGRYLIQIVDEGDDDAELMRAYSLTVTLEAEPDMFDLAAPNEDYSHATTLTSGQMVTGFIAAKSDLDFYAINVNTSNPQVLYVEATLDPASPVDLSFTVFDRDGRMQVCEDAPVCKAFRFVPDNAPQRPNRLATSHVTRQSGRYYVVVRDNQDNEYDTTRSYTVRITAAPEPDANEQYELDRSGARRIGASTSTTGTTIGFPWVEGYISYADDEDWFSFDIPGRMGAPPGQNGDWLVQLDIQKPGPTAVEMQLFFQASDLDYGGYGQSCREPQPGDPDPTGLACQYPDAMNTIDQSFGEAFGNCLVVFREHTGAVGPHYVRITDLNRDDFDVAQPYRFRLTLTARCTPASVCRGMFTDQNGGDLCMRP